MVELQPQPPLRIAIDLTPLLPGGENGGVKPFIWEYLGWLGRQNIHPLVFIFITRRRTHSDVRKLARFRDELVCVLDDRDGGEILTPTHSPREHAWFDAPEDLLARLKVDLLYAPFGACDWQYPGVPTIATAVDVLHRDYPFSLAPADVAARERMFEDMIAKADLIQGISDHTLDRVEFHYGFPRDRMFRSYIAIHERLRRLTEFSDEPTTQSYFIYPANAWKHKNHTVLLLGYNIYCRRIGADAWDLVLTGYDDKAMRDVLCLADVLGLGSKVCFLGHMDERAYANRWRGAGALVFPSLHEGFGIPLVEAMAFGVPILAGRSGSLTEVGGDACLYVDALKPLEIADGLVHVSCDEALRAELQLNARARLRRFCFETDARNFLERLVALAGRCARQTSRGFHPDGWIERRATVITPRWGRRARLRINVRAMPAVRTLRITAGGCPLGSFRVPIARPMSFEVIIQADGRAVSIEVPDSACLSSDDHRVHGVWLKSLLVIDETGECVDLTTNSQ